MNYLMVGGAGFLGSHLTKSLLDEEKNSKIVIYDNFSSGRKSHLNFIISDPRLKIIDGDVKDMQKLLDAMVGIETVFHLAANPDISKAVSEPTIDFWEGTYLTQNILEAMRLTGAKNIFYSSGSGVYGDLPDVHFAEDYGPNYPISTYGASKLAGEALISSYCNMFSMRGRAIRFANIVGPNQTHGVGYDFLRKLKTNPHELSILGDGTQCKSYIYVTDAIAAINLVMKTINKGLIFDVFNVASEDYITVKQIANLVLDVSNIKRENIKLIYGQNNRGWKGDVPKIFFNTSKIKKKGWVAIHDSSEAIKLSLIAMNNELNE
jgi:UDP-glucose 4-epimerase